MGGDDVNAFLSPLAVEQRVAAATQSQALSALLFPNRYVPEDPLPWLNRSGGRGVPGPGCVG